MAKAKNQKVFPNVGTWGGRHKISADDMRAMAVAARPGKTAYEKRMGTHRNRFVNRRQDPSRAPKSS